MNSSQEHRVLIWPADNEGHPSLLASSSAASFRRTNKEILERQDNNPKGNNFGGENNGGRACAIIGWIDETSSACYSDLINAEPESVSKITSCTSIAIGAIPIINCEKASASHAQEGVSDETTPENVSRDKRSNDADVSTLPSLELISSALDLLSDQYPCQRHQNHPDEGEKRGSSSRKKSKEQICGVCEACATFRSLKVLAIVNDTQKDTLEVAPTQESKPEPTASTVNKRNQLIFFDPNEAQTWHDQCSRLLQFPNHGKKQNGNNRKGLHHQSVVYQTGSWHRTLLRLGAAIAVFEEFQLALELARNRPKSTGFVSKRPVDTSYENKRTGLESKVNLSREGTVQTGKLPPDNNFPGDCNGNSGQPKRESLNNSDEKCVENATEDKEEEEALVHRIWNSSLLVLHLANGNNNVPPNRINNGWRSFAAELLGRIPFVTFIRAVRSMREQEKLASLKTLGAWSRRRDRKIFPTSISSTASIFTLVLDSLLGFAIGSCLLLYNVPIIQSIMCLWKTYHDNLLNDGLRWLESFPAGFKLNVALTHQMGKEVKLIMQLHRSNVALLCHSDSLDASTAAADIPTPAASFLWYIGLISSIFGSRFFFALAFDTVRLLLYHINIVSSLFAVCLRVELSTLTSLWLLFRGKKRNILRHRSDHLKYDHMQLLLGMTCFTICIFLFTTILVYNCFFAVVNFVAELAVCGIWWVGFMIVESGMHWDRIVDEKRNCGNSNGFWIGREVQFVPAILPKKGDGNKIELAYWAHFIGSHTGISSSVEAIQTTHIARFERSEQKRDILFPNVSIISDEVVATRITFPMKTEHSLVLSTLTTFVVKRVARIVVLLRCLLFGSSCPVASVLIEITRTVQDLTASRESS